MGTSVKVSYVEKLQEDLQITCKSLEKLGYESFVIVSSQYNHVEMGSARGKRFLETKRSLVGEFFQFCKEASLYGSRFEQQKLNVLNSPRKVNTLADKRHSNAVATTYRQNPPIVVIKPKKSGGQGTGLNTSDDDSDVETDGQHNDMEGDHKSHAQTKSQEPVKGDVLSKAGIIVLTKDDIAKKGSEMMQGNRNHQKIPVAKKASIRGPNAVNTKQNATVTLATSDKPRAKNYFKCDQCDKIYKRNEDLVIHKRKHSGELPYRCVTCGMRFISRNCLRSHVRVHSDATPYGCKECGQLFARPGYLASHVKCVHSNEYSHVCETCGRSFKDSKGLYNHKQIHNNKNFACETCGKRFLRESALNSHRLIHSGVKPYACTICWAEFRMKKNLATHQRRKHPIV